MISDDVTAIGEKYQKQNFVLQPRGNQYSSFHNAPRASSKESVRAAPKRNNSKEIKPPRINSNEIKPPRVNSKELAKKKRNTEPMEIESSEIPVKQTFPSSNYSFPPKSSYDCAINNNTLHHRHVASQQHSQADFPPVQSITELNDLPPPTKVVATKSEVKNPPNIFKDTRQKRRRSSNPFQGGE